MNLLENIDKNKLPKHIAIIMDGNGRWAKQRGKIRAFGHQNGKKAVQKVVENCVKLQIQNLTLYTFSTENWNRPKAEIEALMQLLIGAIKSELTKISENNIRLKTIGNTHLLPDLIKKQLDQAVEKTKNNTGLTLTVALSYGAREELMNACKSICNKVKENIIATDDIDESIINQHLYTQGLPDVDLLIRTSGEQRISNFLLWQIAYAELYFTNVLWPDFQDNDLYEAIICYQNRQRRFGKTNEQIGQV